MRRIEVRIARIERRDRSSTKALPLVGGEGPLEAEVECAAQVVG